MASRPSQPAHGSSAVELPLRDADPRAKVIAALVLVVGIVSASPLSALESGLLALLMVLVGVIAAADVGRVLAKSLLVLPVAGGMAFFAPLRLVAQWNIAGVADAFVAGWPAVLALVVTAWLCTLTMLMLAAITPASELFAAMSSLRVPSALVMLLTFIFRYIDVLRSQVVSMRRALVSRAPGLSLRRQVFLYGNLAGALLIRAHDRGERVNAAMLSRGFSGTLPRTHTPRLSGEDGLLIATSLLVVLALALYR